MKTILANKLALVPLKIIHNKTKILFLTTSSVLKYCKQNAGLK